MSKKICMLLALSAITIKAGNVIAGENSVYGIHEAKSVDEMQKIIDRLTTTTEFDAKKTIGIFDEDNTLVYRYGPEVGNGDMKQWSQLALKILGSEKNKNSIGKWKQTYYRDHIKLLVDQKLPEFVRGLQDTGIRCAVLTSKLNEDLGIDTEGRRTSTHEIYDQEHKNFNLDFGIGWNNLLSTKLNRKSRGNLPDCIDGVIYAGKSQKVDTYRDHNKVIALHKFLEYAKMNSKEQTLKTIIAIDDRLSEIKCLGEYASDNNYHFIGIVFKGYEKLPRPLPFDEQYERERLLHLVQCNEWELPQGAELFYKDENGIWHLKENTTSFMDSTLQSSESETVCKFSKPQGKIDLNGDKSLYTLKQSPCEVTP